MKKKSRVLCYCFPESRLGRSTLPLHFRGIYVIRGSYANRAPLSRSNFIIFFIHFSSTTLTFYDDRFFSGVIYWGKTGKTGTRRKSENGLVYAQLSHSPLILLLTLALTLILIAIGASELHTGKGNR